MSVIEKAMRVQALRQQGVKGPYFVHKTQYGDGTVACLLEDFSRSHFGELMVMCDVLGLPTLDGRRAVRPSFDDAIIDLSAHILDEVIDALQELIRQGRAEDTVIVVMDHTLEKFDPAIIDRGQCIGFEPKYKPMRTIDSLYQLSDLDT